MSESPASRGLRRRYAAERRFRAFGMLAVGTALASLALLLGSVVWKGVPAFFETRLRLDVPLPATTLDPAGRRERAALESANYTAVLRDALQALVPQAADRRGRRELGELVSRGAAYDLRERVLREPERVGSTLALEVPLSDDADLYFKGQIDRSTPESERQLSDAQIGWLDQLAAQGRVQRAFATRLLTSGDSREPELAGVWGATVGSLWTLLVTLALSFPLGVAAAVYLEELAPKSRWTDVIEVNINNLAAVPSIVFGLLGLAVFLNAFGLPRSSPLAGGVVLALLTLPTVIIAGRAAIRAVPPSIREAALGVGASRLQMVTHHVLPLALPGILTGTILGMARALGESAPLLMIGMVAFIVDVPSGALAPATVLPVQIYLWADSAEAAFVSRTSAAILVLLVFLVLMNLTAVLLRSRFERRW
jgi:phosphate transport system permease protein